MADSLWINVIQDFDFCEQSVGNKLCKSNGWVMQMLLAISYLSPHFRMPMYVGPLMLTVVVNDIPGASKVFDRAVQLFPSDWHILYAAAYQAMIEEKDKDKAAKLLQAAAAQGAPPWTYALAAKLYSEAGEEEFVRRLYENLKQSGLDPMIIDEIRQRLHIK